MQRPHWEHFSHPSDIGVRGIGGTREEAFAQAALALTAVVTEPSRVADDVSVELSCAGVDEDFLLLDWLNRVIFEMDTRSMLFSRYVVCIESAESGLFLRATAFGETVDVGRHRPAVEVKAATWAGLRVTCDADGTWTAECVLDV